MTARSMSRSSRNSPRYDASASIAKMSWALHALGAPGLESQVYSLPNDSIAHIVLYDSQDSLRVVHELPNPAAGEHAELGRIG